MNFLFYSNQTILGNATGDTFWSVGNPMALLRRSYGLCNNNQYNSHLFARAPHITRRFISLYHRRTVASLTCYCSIDICMALYRWNQASSDPRLRSNMQKNHQHFLENPLFFLNGTKVKITHELSDVKLNS